MEKNGPNEQYGQNGQYGQYGQDGQDGNIWESTMSNLCHIRLLWESCFVKK